MTAASPHAAATERMRQLPDVLLGYAGFAEAARTLASGRPASFDGVWGSACALVAAALARQSRGPLVVILPTDRAADDTAADLELFTGQEPTFFPAWETAPDERLVHDETFGERLRVLKTLMRRGERPLGHSPEAATPSAASTRTGLSRFIKARGGQEDPAPSSGTALNSGTTQLPETLQPPGMPGFPTAPILVTSIQALLQPSPTTAAIAAATRTLKKSERIEIDELLRWLVERGFHATSAVELPGEFSHRGGILDIFAPDWVRPVRVELFDDEIESLRSFEVSTQRSHETLDEIEVTVLRTEGGSAGHLTDYLPPDAWI